MLSAAKSLQQEKLELADLVENLNHSLESRNANILMLVWDGSETEKNKYSRCRNKERKNSNNTPKIKSISFKTSKKY